MIPGCLRFGRLRVHLLPKPMRLERRDRDIVAIKAAWSLLNTESVKRIIDSMKPRMARIQSGPNTLALTSPFLYFLRISTQRTE